MISNWNRNIGYSWLLAALLPLFAVVIALSTPIEEHTYDAASFHVYRSVVFADALADGSLYPRWVMPINAGLGGPLFNFYSPAVYYLMAGLHAVGLPLPIAWRVFVALSLEVGALGLFGLVLALFKRADLALVASACFTYAPYLLRDFFERGAPQGTAVALCPWLLWALLRLAERPSGRRLVAAVGYWAAILLMHNLTGLMVLPVAGIFSLYLAARYGTRALALPVTVLVLGILLSAFHVVPFLLDSRNVQLESASRDLSSRLIPSPVTLGDLLAPTAVFDIGLDNNTTGYSIGLLYALILPLGLVVAVARWRKKYRAETFLAEGFALLGLTLVWMQTSASDFVWLALPQLNIMQFRTRLLMMLGLIAAVLLAYLLSELPDRFKPSRPLLVPLLTGAFILLQLPILYPQLLHRYIAFSPSPTVSEGQAWALANHFPGFTLTTTKELLPRWRQNTFTDDEVRKVAAGPVDNLPDGARVTGEERSTGHLRLTLDSPVGMQAALHVMYYPGWIATLNGQPQPIQPMEASGYTLIDLPAGTNTVDLRYEGTPAEHLGNWLSLLSLLTLIGFAVGWRNRRKEDGSQPAVYFNPRWWIPAAIVLLVIVKAVWIDPQTTLLRAASTCEVIEGAGEQTSVTFDGIIRLCGYTLSGTALQPGDMLRVILYWQIDQALDRPLYSFVHVLGSSFNPETGNPLWGQQDNQTPGWLPTTLWLPGKLYQDQYDIQVAPHAPAGDYQLEIGWYTPDGSRLKPTVTLPSAALHVSDLDALNIAGIIIR